MVISLRTDNFANVFLNGNSNLILSHQGQKAYQNAMGASVSGPFVLGWNVITVVVTQADANSALGFAVEGSLISSNHSLGYPGCCSRLPIPANLNVGTATITPGMEKCYNAINYIVVAGNDSLFTVQNGGSATFIAGEKINFLPGTKVLSGGYMNGTIAPNGPFCSTVKIAESENTPGSEFNKENSSQLSGGFFKVYPNPTTGEFSLELKGLDETAELRVELYGMQGERILSEELKGSRKYDLSLAGKPNGIYFIRVITGNHAGTGKIIKQ
jgi:hypothetical protein